MDGNSQAVVRALGAVVLWSTAASAFRLSLDHGTPWQVLVVASATSTAVFLRRSSMEAAASPAGIFGRLHCGEF